MIDYRPIEVHIRRARLQRSAVLGELIADAILAVWFGAKRFSIGASAMIKKLVESPDEYSTAMPRRF